VLVGPVAVELPPHPDITVTGPLDEADKWDIVHDALVSVSPSALESFSLVVIEAWVDRVPVLVNGACGPTREHCERSGGGLWFTSYPEFEAVLERLVADSALRERLGVRGRAYVDTHFRWPVLIRRYDEFITAAAERGRGTPGLF
jgi:glycosyltransferase involved in cell wall biosynthesis